MVPCWRYLILPLVAVIAVVPTGCGAQSAQAGNATIFGTSDCKAHGHWRSVHGRVVDGEGNGVAGARVETSLEVGEHCIVFTDAAGDFEGHVPTARCGFSYSVARAWHPTDPELYGVWAQGLSPSDSKKATIPLQPLAHVAGYVADSGGNAMAGVRVRVEGLGRAQPFVTAESDSSGRYLFAVAPTNSSITLEAGLEGHGDRSRVSVNLLPKKTVEAPDLILVPETETVAGRAILDTGAPIAGMRIVAAGAVTGSRGDVTDAHGRFNITGLCDEPLTVSARYHVPHGNGAISTRSVRFPTHAGDTAIELIVPSNEELILNPYDVFPIHVE